MDTYTWRVVCSDGTVLAEGRGARYEDIDRARLRAFEILSGETVALRVHLEGTRRLVFRRRRRIGMDGSQTMIIIAGWVDTIAGQEVRSLCYLYPGSKIIMAGASDDLILHAEEQGGDA